VSALNYLDAHRPSRTRPLAFEGSLFSTREQNNHGNAAVPCRGIRRRRRLTSRLLIAEKAAAIDAKNLRAHECVESVMLRLFCDRKMKGLEVCEPAAPELSRECSAMTHEIPMLLPDCSPKSSLRLTHYRNRCTPILLPLAAQTKEDRPRNGSLI
jgi:hypothetical protein